jgi:hypothetical protein
MCHRKCVLFKEATYCDVALSIFSSTELRLSDTSLCLPISSLAHSANGDVQSWLPLAQNCEYWKQIGTEWVKHQQALTSNISLAYEHHPLFEDSILDYKYQ